MSREYSSSNSANSRGSNDYNSLSTYTAGYSMNVPAVGNPSSGSYIVPTWGSIGYNSLTMGGMSTSGYGNISSAYGAGAAKCQQAYTTSLCSGR